MLRSQCGPCSFRLHLAGHLLFQTLILSRSSIGTARRIQRALQLLAGQFLRSPRKPLSFQSCGQIDAIYCIYESKFVLMISMPSFDSISGELSMLVQTQIPWTSDIKSCQEQGRPACTITIYAALHIRDASWAMRLLCLQCPFVTVQSLGET